MRSYPSLRPQGPYLFMGCSCPRRGEEAADMAEEGSEWRRLGGRSQWGGAEVVLPPPPPSGQWHSCHRSASYLCSHDLLLHEKRPGLCILHCVSKRISGGVGRTARERALAKQSPVKYLYRGGERDRRKVGPIRGLWSRSIPLWSRSPLSLLSRRLLDSQAQGA